MKQILAKLLLSWALVAVAILQPASAESLEEAWRTALGTDQWLEAGRSRVAAAADELAAARAGRLPSLSASAGYNRFDEPPAFDFSGAGVPATLPLFDGDTMETADARVTLPLYAGGQVRHGIDAAQSALDSTRSRSAADEQQVKLEVARRYVDVLRAEQALSVADSSVASLGSHVADVEDAVIGRDAERAGPGHVQRHRIRIRRMHARAARGDPLAHSRVVGLQFPQRPCLHA